jgi:hypothetical protein
MSAHTDRLLRLMVENGVTNTAVLERLNAVRWGAVAESWKISQTWDFSAATGGFYLQLIIQRCMNQKIVCQI